MKALPGVVVAHVLIHVFADRIPGRAFAEQSLEDALHLRKREALAKPIQLGRGGAQLVDEDALLGNVARPPIGQLVLAARRIELADELTDRWPCDVAEQRI